MFVFGFVSVEWVLFWLELLFGLNGYEIFVVEFDSFIGKIIIVVVIVFGVVILFSIYLLVEDVISGVLDELKFVFFVLGVIWL